MGTIDKVLFSRQGANDCGNSDYWLGLTSCCSSWLVEDIELGTLYLDPKDLSQTKDGFSSLSCPLCGAAPFEIKFPDTWPREPNPWQWAFHSDQDIVTRWQRAGENSGGP